MPAQPSPSPADQFSDDEMDQMKRHGQAMLGGTRFSEEVEKELTKFHQRREANAGKMQAAMTGGGDTDLGPSGMDIAQAKQTQALQQQATTQGAQQAVQAQGAQMPLQPPAAPGGAAGMTKPFPAQAGPQPTPPAEPPQPLPQEQQEPPPAPEEA